MTDGHGRAAADKLKADAYESLTRIQSGSARRLREVTGLLKQWPVAAVSADRSSLREAQIGLEDTQLRDSDGQPLDAYVMVGDDHIRYFATLIEHGYRVDRSRPYVCLGGPSTPERGECHDYRD